MFVIIALILITIVLTARLANRFRLPLILIALGCGVFFGSDVTGLVYFDDAVMAKHMADVALIFVLFFGGFTTRRDNLRLVMAPALVLSTIGVAVTAVITGFSLWMLLDYGLTYALLLGAIIASTDAAAVFSILRSKSVTPRLAALTEAESATNDPMAILLTTFILQLITAQTRSPLQMGLGFGWQLAGGIAIGLLVGKTGCMLFERIKTVDKGYFYVLIVGIILFAYGLADSTRSSGILSAFFAGYVMGNSSFPYKRNIATFLDALSTIANVGIFVLLGLLVFPHQFGAIWKQGVALFLVLTFIARPAAVFVCTSFSGLMSRERIFLAWSGLRGAVPIVLATYPAAAGLKEASDIFNVIFFAVTLSVLIQGSTIGKMAGWLKVAIKAKPKPDQVMELVTIHESDLELCELQIDDDLYRGRTTVSSLKLPEGTTITMINRSERIIAPAGATEILPGDILYVLTHHQNIESVMQEILSHFEPLQAGHNEPGESQA